MSNISSYHVHNEKSNNCHYIVFLYLRRFMAIFFTWNLQKHHRRQKQSIKNCFLKKLNVHLVNQVSPFSKQMEICRFHHQIKWSNIIITLGWLTGSTAHSLIIFHFGLSSLDIANIWHFIWCFLTFHWIIERKC
jgi:hypothetical protein